MREGCFDELARRAPGTTGEDDLGSVDGCVAQAADAALAAVRPAYRDVLLLRDVHGLDTPALCAVADMGESDVEHLLYRARAEFASAFATLPADPRCRASRERDGCADCAERERLRATPQYALLQLGPLPVRERVRAELAPRPQRPADARRRHGLGARAIAPSSRAAAPLSSISLRLPHFGDCTHDGQPSRQRQSPTTRAALATSSAKRSCPRWAMPTPPAWPS